MTMIGGLSSGLNRVTSASFSFIIAVPVMIIVVIYELVSSISQLSVINYFWVFFGASVSFVVALATMRWFLRIVVNQGLTFFGWYRIILGVVGLVFYI